ncbi:hypothetical protein AVEN_228015-1, partial [Araneus ventricosus]
LCRRASGGSGSDDFSFGSRPRRPADGLKRDDYLVVEVKLQQYDDSTHL